jgi:hypothetical protein
MAITGDMKYFFLPSLKNISFINDLRHESKVKLSEERRQADGSLYANNVSLRDARFGWPRLDRRSAAA